MLSQLVYVSTRKSSCTAEEIEKILSSCKKNNPNFNITGCLVYSENKFIQYLEGDSKEILGLYDKIKTDDRHENAIMVSYCSIKQRVFPSWHMATQRIASDDIQYRTNITLEDKMVFEGLLKGEKNDDLRAIKLLKKFFDKETA